MIFYSIAYLVLASVMNSGDGTNRFLKKLADFQYRVHDDGRLSCHSDGSPLEADLLVQVQPPSRSLLSANKRSDAFRAPEIWRAESSG